MLPPEPQARFADIEALPAPAPTSIVRYSDHPEQFAEFWHPGPSCPRLVVLIHGGCWRNAYSVEHVRPLAAALGAAGFAVWAIEYRRLGDEGGGYPGTFADVAMAINAASRLENVDTSSVVVVGHSSGGHLALWISADGVMRDERFATRIPICGAVGLAAITDLERYAAGTGSCGLAAAQLLDSHPDLEDAATRSSLSPQYLSRSQPAILIHGDADAIVPMEQVTRLVEKQQISLRTVPGGHFDLIHPRHASFSMLETAIGALFERHAA